ncbi:hypothetical protein CORC01_00166 [Colletotrichum orchidophilum]|uniref:Uncharacterized protein n=1 Tax=Colletotrichum orchidophilum TaxID=1209926 RepID=A0A1G4BTL1_9PEZI|nr:uncharacterized protein CORC01_00166 [Colletotrichum orchidophilum]OHF04695.1 hypothetical protein CORC01_00166 [Colletotrichum orchidophilum]
MLCRVWQAPAMWALLAVAAADEPIPDTGSVGPGAIAGIVIAGVFVVGLLGVAVMLARNRTW